MEIIIAFICGILLTSIGAFLYRKTLFLQGNLTFREQIRILETEKNRLVAELGLVKGELSSSMRQLNELKPEYQYQVSQAVAAKEELAGMRSQLRSAEEKLQEQKIDLEKIGEHLRFEFKSLANSILEEKTKKFTELNEEKMSSLLNPLKVKMDEFKLKVEETYQKESNQRFSLEQKISDLVALNSKLSDEANNLTNAFKMNNKVQGNWGEMILESLLEHSGLTKNREYFVQEFLKDTAGNIIRDEHGKSFQPDITIVYPDGRKVIVDSKVSLIAYDAYASCARSTDQVNCLKEHIRSVRSHIDGLSGKNYPKYAGQALDYVILFIPIEPAFLVAVKEDVSLWKYAYDRRILMVSPTNLLAVLKIIADLWKVELQSRNAIAIAERAGNLYDKFVSFTKNMEDVGENLKKAHDAHAAAMGQLSSGKGNLIRQTQQLKDMGAKANKKLPDHLLNGVEMEHLLE
ncbi:MAG TPA: DNA recombination protein RmuC [Flavitalea sp.]|nr:DNA recombination protein RmuC [Flavitalea sp.]